MYMPEHASATTHGSSLLYSQLLIRHAVTYPTYIHIHGSSSICILFDYSIIYTRQNKKLKLIDKVL